MTHFIKVFILSFFGFCSLAAAQTWELGLTGGAMGYMGDLNQNNPLALNHPALGLTVKRNIDSYWAIKFGVLQGKISDDESKSKYQQEINRNLSFFSPVTEGSVSLEFNLFDYGFEFRQKRFTPFLFAGVALAGFNPKTDFNGDVYELVYYKTEGQAEEYKTIAFSVPYGAGVKYNFGRYFNIIGEIGYRNTNTDYLDDVSGVYPDPSKLAETDPNKTALRQALSDRSAGKIGNPGTQRGDFRKKDSYLFVGITLSYTFVSQKCPF
ncbi:hypothetical protein BCY91_09110 [Pelobium manganitolerans]|uniref:DUF6089 domain-containing protein n=1 Tax=Pelobium manganitolerans TaxID=1842495 RepID=A0A419S343_9SPHI|nr:DUF6089 family protein [Pelobium manganitolerans]RKD13718.1 hypothetical protein BCY91_09110 [Pelobium manganitolerans]